MKKSMFQVHLFHFSIEISRFLFCGMRHENGILFLRDEKTDEFSSFEVIFCGFWSFWRDFLQSGGMNLRDEDFPQTSPNGHILRDGSSGGLCRQNSG